MGPGRKRQTGVKPCLRDVRYANRFLPPRPTIGVLLGDSLAVELAALTRAALVQIQVPQPVSLTRKFPSLTQKASACIAVRHYPICLRRWPISANSDRKVLTMRARALCRPVVWNAGLLIAGVFALEAISVHGFGAIRSKI